MLAAETKKKYTVEDYMLLEEGAPFQLIDYELIMSPSPHAKHQAIVARLSQILCNFLDEQNIDGYVAGSMDVVFDQGNVYQPDLLYISTEREDEIVKAKIEGAPDLVIEILSPSKAYYDLRQKKELYEKYGVNEYIIIDPIAKNADLYTLKDGLYTLRQRAQKPERLNSVLLVGLSFDLGKIFK